MPFKTILKDLVQSVPGATGAILTDVLGFSEIGREDNLVRFKAGDTTIGATHLTPDQRRLIVALAEPRLRGDGRASVVLPSSADAAARLGWTITRFNR